MLDLLNQIDSFVWGPPLLILLVGTGIWLTIRLNLIQVFKLIPALKLIFGAKSEGEGDVSSFKALCTALAATVGTGNIVGVATAVKMWSGWGFPHSFVWRLSALIDCSQLNIVLWMTTAISPVVPCTTSKKVWARNTNLWQLCLQLSV